MAHNSLESYYETNFALVQHHKYSLTELENMLPWEREVYIALLQKNVESFFNKFVECLKKYNELPSLTVLKSFGDIESVGMMSFPRKGVTLAIDFPNKGNSTKKLFDELDLLVNSYEGAIYPAKDSRMSKETFQKSFPQKLHFEKNIDPLFSSNFWERVR